MTVRRVVLSGVGAAVVALLLSACGASPILPPLVGLTSPYRGSSVTSLFNNSQTANVLVCSITGGPLTVDVHSPGADGNTGVGVHATSTDPALAADPDAARLMEFVQEQAVGVDTHLVSERALHAGECADVQMGSSQYFFDPGLPFSYTITW
jgi:hypothetical protein